MRARRRETPATFILRYKAVTVSTAPVLASRILAILHEAGHTAYLVGGCVRDLLLDRAPKDFDVATSARPDELLRLFPGSGLVGAHFGVVLVKEDGAGTAAVEVATFRSDHVYRDGRRPEGVTFEMDPREDARRRDFTINAMMMDPRSGAVLDYVGGRADLQARVIRTVGDAMARFGEDHLRLLRAVRFAARLGFEIEADTFEAMRALAGRVRTVSTERVREELVRILTEGGARRGVELLAEAGLLAEVTPEVVVTPEMLGMLSGLARGCGITLAMAVLLYGVAQPAAVLERLRFSNDAIARVGSLVAGQRRFPELHAMGESELKRFLRGDWFDEQLELYRLHGEATGLGREHYAFARHRLKRYSREDLFPARLLTGDDLIALGMAPGPEFGRLLDALETAQLEGRVTTRDQALALVRASNDGSASEATGTGGRAL